MLFYALGLLSAHAKPGGRAGECNLIDRFDPAAAPEDVTGSLRVAVDLGYRQGAPNLSGLRDVALDFNPAVVVLTHADTDHIGGAVNFFPDLAKKDPPPGSLAVRQLWVPSEWGLLAFCIARMAQEPLEAARSAEEPRAPIVTPKLIEERASGGDIAGPLPCFRVSELLRDDQVREEKSTNQALNEFLSTKVSFKGREAGIVTEIAEHVDAFRETIDPRATDLTRRWAGEPMEVAQRVFDQSKHILTVLRQAVNSGVEVRLFSVDIPPSKVREPFEYAGIPGHLTLINAVEVEFLRPSVRAFAATLLRADRLTLQNRRALVTFVWPTSQGAADGLIIWSDSDGRIAQADQQGPRTPWSLTRYMTAPHHGSKND